MTFEIFSHIVNTNMPQISNITINKVGAHRMIAAAVAILAVTAAFGMGSVAVAEPVSTDSGQEINGHKYCLVSVSTAQDSVAPGETVTVTATVENRGSKEGSISTYLGLRGPNGDRWYPSGDRAYDIPIGGRATLEFSAEIPADAATGPYELTVDVWTGNDAEMFHTSGWLQQFDVEEPTTDAEITWTAASGTYEPGDRVPVDVSVENTGDTAHEFYVDASLQRPDGSWITGEGTTVPLRPGAQRTVYLGVNIPDSSPPGTYEAGAGIFETSGTDQSLDTARGQQSVTVEARNTTVTIDGGQVAGEAFDPGERVPVELTVSNEGNTATTAYVDASLQRPSGDWITGEGRTVELAPWGGPTARTRS